MKKEDPVHLSKENVQRNYDRPRSGRLFVVGIGLIGWGPRVLGAAHAFPGFVLPIVQADMRIWRYREAEFWIRSGASALKFTIKKSPHASG